MRGDLFIVQVCRDFYIMINAGHVFLAGNMVWLTFCDYDIIQIKFTELFFVNDKRVNLFAIRIRRG